MILRLQFILFEKEIFPGWRVWTKICVFHTVYWTARLQEIWFLAIQIDQGAKRMEEDTRKKTAIHTIFNAEDLFSFLFQSKYRPFKKSCQILHFRIY